MNQSEQELISYQYSQILGMADCFESEQEFETLLNSFLVQFDVNDQKMILVTLREKFPAIRCLQRLLNNILQQEGCVSKGINLAQKVAQIVYTPPPSRFEVLKQYNQAKQSGESGLIQQLLENEQFVNQMGFPIGVENIKDIILNLKQDGLKIFDILEQCQKPTLSLNRNFLLDIVYFIFKNAEMNETDLQRLLKFLGSATSKLIIQFQYLLHELKINNEENFSQFIEELQSVQVGKKDQSNISEFRKNQLEYDLIVRVATMQTNNVLEYFHNQIKSILQITGNNIKYQYQETIDAIFINENGQAQVIYFLSLFSLWCISRQEELAQFQHIKRSKDKGKVKTQIDQAQQTEKDQLMNFLLGKLFCFNQQFEVIDRELEKLIQQQWTAKQALEGLAFESPNQLFELADFFKIQTYGRQISEQTLKKIFQDQPLISNLISISQLIPQKNLEDTLRFIITIFDEGKVDDICHYLDASWKSDCTLKDQSVFFFLFCLYFEFDIRDYKILNKFIATKISKQYLRSFLIVNHISENTDVVQLLQELEGFSKETWDFILKHINNQILATLFILLAQFYLDRLPESPQSILPIMKRFNSIVGLEAKYQAIQIFLKFSDENLLHQIYLNNSQLQLSFEQYSATLNLIISVLLQQKQQQNQLLKDFIGEFKSVKFYEVDYLCMLISKKIDRKILNEALALIYLEKINDLEALTQKATIFSKQNPKMFEEILVLFPESGFSKITLNTKKTNNSISSQIIQQEEKNMEKNLYKQIQIDFYPVGGQLSLEEFNISLALMTEEQQYGLVNDWVTNMKDVEKFVKLVPFFFNILKRGEKIKDFVSLVNQAIKKNQLSKQSGFFNLKSLFQILYNNSNPELQVMLLKLQSKGHPIPLVYRKISEQDREDEILQFNANAFYVFQEGYTIINFCLNENQRRIGKTFLINQIFYQGDKFEICDNCEINTQTIDIMLDQCFSGTRNFIVADTHNFIPLASLDRVLPLFRLWIIQVDGENEIEQMLQQLTRLNSYHQKQKRKIFLLIRNSSPECLTEDLITQLKSHQIIYLQLEDLTDPNLNKQMIESEIQTVAKNLFLFISIHYQNDKVSQNDFLELINNNIQCKKFIKEFNQNLKIIEELNQELLQVINSEDGFYNANAFPIRHLEFRIKQLKAKYQAISGNMQNDQQQEELQSINESIQQLQQKIQLQTSTNLLRLFCEIFEKKNHYILYLWFVDRIRQFNEHHTYKLQDENQKLIETNQQLKKDKEQLKQKEKKQNEVLVSNIREKLDQINSLIQKNKEKLEKNLEIIALRNIGIELFWREIISQQQYCKQFQLNIEPAQIVHSMIAKGEPFEFLDGDQLKIDQKFLQSLIEQFKNKGNERVLVLSVLGPQSSGKSTILNKIFGCHFWTSVGRCTKGIYLQLLKIQNKKYFHNLFDYILILDTEGLQSPNQEDQEFDKKIALFVLAISDIILINVKGDIHQQFKNLVEMCIFTLGQMKNFSSVKQISWCFNQNNDVSNFSPFLQQLQGIAQNLNVQIAQNDQEGPQIDYNDILGIYKENIQILGFAQTELTWRKNESNGIYADWRQQILNEAFAEEAYLYGLRVIKTYSEKLRQQQEYELQNLKYFIQIVGNNWQSIQRLPDLLEFSELIQHQQNTLMSREFDIIIKSRDFAITQDMIRDIHEKIFLKGTQVNLAYFQELQQEKAREANSILDQILQDFLQQLLQIKNQHKISKKISQKYISMIKERIKSQSLECQLSMHNEIKNHETEFQKKKGFFHLDNFVSNLNHKPEELKKLKDDPNLLKQKFKELWENIMDQQTKSQEEMFLEFSKKLFGIISQEFQIYILKSKNEEDYQNFFFKQIIKQPPSQKDFQDIFNIFSVELEQPQFMAIEKAQKNYQYTEIFYKKFQLKLKSQKDTDLLDISQFYGGKIQIVYVEEKQFAEYLKKDFFDDIKESAKNKQLKDSEKQKNKSEILLQTTYQFLAYLGFFGILIDQKESTEFTKSFSKDSYFFNLESEFQKLISKKCIPIPCNLQYLHAIKNLYRKLILQEKIIEYDETNPVFYENVVNDLIQQQHLHVLFWDLKITAKNHLDREIKYIFDYLSDQNKQEYRYYEFKYLITKSFTTLMNNEDGKCWKRIYLQIYQMVVQETIRTQQQEQQNIPEQNDVEVVVSQYNASLIRIIMAKIEKMIKGFNIQFANFGIIFNDLGERCIYYFSILIIWRILCYGQWRMMADNIQKLEAQTNEQFLKFQADIQQNKREQSIVRGNALATEILNLAIDKYYLENSKAAQDSLKQFQNATCFSVIKELDQQILEKGDPNITDDQIMDYIRNHSEYIEKVVNKKISDLVAQIQGNLQQLKRNEIKQHLIKIQRNTRNLKNFSVDPIKAQDYFIDGNKNNNKINYEHLLYKMVLECLQGIPVQDFQLIKKEHQEAFDVTGFVKIDTQIVASVQRSSDSEIQVLMHFIAAFDDKISAMIKSCDTLVLNLSKLNVQTILDEMKLNQIGCLQTCPVCKRKCDQDPKDQTHKHACLNGHQLRGMNGVLIKNNPSLFTCEEITDEFQIEEQETKTIKKWKDIKAAYSNWQFSCLSNDELKKYKTKFMNIWNNKIGQMICKQLEKDLGVTVYYIPKHEIDPNQMAARKIHYILIMDDSGSMQGSKWSNIQNGAISFMWEMAKNPLAKITVIIFNSNARCVIDFQSLNPHQQGQQIQFNGGGTEFDSAFTLAYDKIIQNREFSQYEHQMFFYTDGYASFPAQSIAKFKNLKNEQKQKIELIACTEERDSPILDQIVKELKSVLSHAESRNSVQPQQIGQFWVETISKKYHKLEC